MLGLLLMAPLAAQAGGTVVPAEFQSAALGRAWTYNVYLPEGYETAHLRYPVLYLLHGVGQNRDEWVQKGQVDRIADLLIAAGQMPPCVIVMPTGLDSWFVDNGSEKMQSAFADDLVPYIDQHYHTIPQKVARVIAGESMGGFGSLRLLMLNPNMFSAAALLSPAIYNPLPPEASSARKSAAFQTDGAFDPMKWRRDNYPALMGKFVDAKVVLPLYIMSGIDDEFRIQDQARILYDVWRQHGWPARLLLLAGRHNFDVWRPAMPDALRYIFARVPRPRPDLARLTALRRGSP